MTRASDNAPLSPAADGFAMPAEWEPHRRTWMCWPARQDAFGDRHRLLTAKEVCARVARAVAAYEPVVMVARPDDSAEARQSVGDTVTILDLAIDDGWARDVGPTFLKDRRGAVAGVQWRFNAWGGKYHPYTDDATLASRLLQREGRRIYRPDLTCEGGAIHSNGAGIVLTTEQCLLNANRNPGRSKDAVEGALKRSLGARDIVWLGEGFSDDETDGHVDNIACFVGPRRVLLGVPPLRSHPDWAPIAEARRRLLAFRGAGCETLEVIDVVQPQRAALAWTGKLAPRSYVNFYVANGAVVVPAFDDPHDGAAARTIAACFPDRALLPIDAADLVEGGGGIHCITQQEPAP